MTKHIKDLLPSLDSLPFEVYWETQMQSKEYVSVRVSLHVNSYWNANKTSTYTTELFNLTTPLAWIEDSTDLFNAAVRDAEVAYNLGIIRNPVLREVPEPEPEADPEEENLLNLINSQLPIWLSGESEQANEAYVTVRDAVTEVLRDKKDELAATAVTLMEDILGPQKSKEFGDKLIIDATYLRLMGIVKDLGNFK